MKKGQKNFERLVARVDMQVLVLVFIFTCLATIITSVIYWNFTFEVMMTSLEERAYALHDAVEDVLDKDSFLDIENNDDMETELYQKAKDTLLQMKNSADVLYLYSAKLNSKGDLIYVIDGLEEDGDFRVPGDYIEEDIVPDMLLSLEGNEVLPDEILHTDWGEIFVSYFPIHDESGEILGVIGIEFDASETYNTFTNLVAFVPFIVLILSSIASLASITIFRRISNPLYKDMSTKDMPTGLKNRNAFDVDLHNLMSRNQSENIAIIIIDLDNLKGVNDSLGHSAGDDYIRLVSKAVLDNKSSNMVGYRIGGDEFIIIVSQANQNDLDSFIDKCVLEIENQSLYPEMKCSISYGICIYDKSLDKDLEDTSSRADKKLYIMKREHKEKSA